MSTRSEIGILNPDNSVTTVYHHFDGYLEGVGRMLLENYNTKDKLYIGIKEGFDESSKYTYKYSSINEWIKRELNLDREFLYLYKNNNWYYCEINFLQNWEILYKQNYKKATSWKLVSEGLKINNNLETE